MSVAMKRLSHLAGLTALLLAATGPLAAQQHINNWRGFRQDGAFALGELDSINLFNGNLTVRLPIGPEFRLDETTAYQLRLTYNSNLWAFKEICQSEGGLGYELTAPPYPLWEATCVHESPDGHCQSYEWTEGGDTMFDPPIPNVFGDDFEPRNPNASGTVCRTIAEPYPLSNAGLGWQLQLANLLPPREENSDWLLRANQSERWMFVDPDGGEHLFFERLHTDDDGHWIEDPDDPAVGVTYSRDGSYLRMRVVAGDGAAECGGPTAAAREVDTPDGLTYRFVPGPDPEILGWRLRGVHDRRGLGFSICYGADGEWQISDTAGRQHVVRFATLAGGEDSGPVVTEVELVGNGGPRTWRFGYAEHQVERGCPSSVSPGEESLELSLLTSVTTPSGEVFEMPLNGSGDDAYDLSGDAGHCSIRGALLHLDLPAGGRLEWSYEPDPDAPQWWDRDNQRFNGYIYPSGSTPRAYSRQAYGVFRRRVIPDRRDSNPDPGQIEEWKYKPYLKCALPDAQTACECAGIEEGFCLAAGNHIPEVQPRQFRNEVTGPDGSVTVHYFSAFPVAESPTADNGYATGYEYGLPFARDAGSVTGEDGQPLYLSWQAFAPEVLGGELLRAGYVRYDYDLPGANLVEGEFTPFVTSADKGFGEVVALNRREVASRVVEYHSGVEKFYLEERYQDFDGLGHFRVMKSGGHGPNPPSYERTVTTSYNPTQSYPGGFTTPDPGSPWLLNLYGAKTTAQQGRTLKSESCFDADTGLLTGERTLRGWNDATHGWQSVPTHSDRDVTRRIARELDGETETVTESFYGGDLARNAVDVCSASPPTPEYEVRRTFRCGSLATEEWLDPASGAVVLRPVDREIDCASGQVLSAQDPDGRTVRFEYDAANRPQRASIAPGQGAAAAESVTVFTYTTTPFAYQLDRCEQPPGYGGSDCGGRPLSHETLKFDGLGRVSEDLADLPQAAPGDPARSRQRFAYGYGGGLRLEQESSVAAESSAQVDWTKKLYDQFGRMVELQLPRRDGPPSDWATHWEYTGGFLTRRTDVIWRYTDAAPGGASEGVDSGETRDLFGRVTAVRQRVDSTSGAQTAPLYATAFYEYDPGDHLQRVRQKECPEPQGGVDDCWSTGGTELQSREFLYDGRGFLRKEKLPEIGATGNGWRYFEYDSLGKVVRRYLEDPEPGPGPFNLFYRYDKAGRLIRVSALEAQGSEGTPPLKQFHYSVGGGRFGRWSAGKLVQAKRANAGSTWVTEEFFFDDPDGQVSTQTTRIAGVTRTWSFRQGLDRDPLGNLTLHQYPQRLCFVPGCADPAPAREALLTYDKGRLEQVASRVGSTVRSVSPLIAYHPNGLPREIQHEHLGGTVSKELIGNDLAGLVRPRSIGFLKAGGTSGQSLGTYLYDGIGNVFDIGDGLVGTAAGDDVFSYDGAGRLRYASLDVDPGVVENRIDVLHTFDGAGNLRGVSKNGVGELLDAVSSSTNRLTSSESPPTVAYDSAGNLVLWRGHFMSYDAFSSMDALRGQGVNSKYYYTAGDERVAIEDEEASEWRLRLRGEGQQVVREFVVPMEPGPWRWSKDWLFREGKLLASFTSSESGERLQHYFLDHLGTPRYVANGENASANLTGYREYFPFGEQANSPVEEEEVHQFTGHERDQNCLRGECAGLPGRIDDLDYMHARYYNPWLGRFLTVDPLPGRLEQPQSANGYAYALNSPLAFTDLTGMDPCSDGGTEGSCSAFTYTVPAENEKQTGKAWDRIRHPHANKGVFYRLVLDNGATLQGWTTNSQDIAKLLAGVKGALIAEFALAAHHSVKTKKLWGTPTDKATTALSDQQLIRAFGVAKFSPDAKVDLQMCNGQTCARELYRRVGPNGGKGATLRYTEGTNVQIPGLGIAIPGWIARFSHYEPGEVRVLAPVPEEDN
jgi:RHS repeat-associated protein